MYPCRAMGTNFLNKLLRPIGISRIQIPDDRATKALSKKYLLTSSPRALMARHASFSVLLEL